MIREKLYRVQELHNEGGINEVARGFRDYFYYMIQDAVLPEKTYRERRADIDERWKFIEPYVDESTTLLDIGCAEGYYTIKTAEAGAFALGADLRSERLKNAREREGYPDRVGFLKWELNPENIQKLPNMDVILLLTVQHHWQDAFGLNAAEEMFQHVMDKCDFLIYEPPGDRPIIKSEEGTISPSQSIDFYTARLNALYGDSIEVKDVMLTEFRTDKERHLQRKDPLFAIDTSGFSLKAHTDTGRE